MTDDILLQKAEAYFILGEVVHVTYKTGHWVNGIVKRVSSDFFMFDELEDGLIPIFYKEISSITKYTPKKEEKSDGIK